MCVEVGRVRVDSHNRLQTKTKHWYSETSIKRTPNEADTL